MLRKANKHSRIALILLLSVLTIFNGCKKDQSKSNPKLSEKAQLQSAKNWYLDSKKNVSFNLKGSNGVSVTLEYYPDWDKAQVVYENDKAVVAMPLRTNLEKLMSGPSKFSLVIAQTESGYVSKTVSVKSLTDEIGKADLTPVQLYNAAFGKSAEISSDVDVTVFGKTFGTEKHLQFRDNQQLLITTDRKLDAKEIDKQMSLAGKIPTSQTGGDGCLFWVMVTTNYDSEGNITSSTSDFVNFTCDTTAIDWIQPGDPGPEPSTPDLGYQVSEKFQETVEDEISEQDSDDGIARRKIFFGWTFHRGTTGWTAQSYERSTQKKVNGIWLFDSMSHISASATGTFINNEVTIIMNYTDGNVTNGGLQAEMTLNYKIQTVGAYGKARFVNIKPYPTLTEAWSH